MIMIDRLDSLYVYKQIPKQMYQYQLSACPAYCLTSCTTLRSVQKNKCGQILYELTLDSDIVSIDKAATTQGVALIKGDQTLAKLR